MSAAQIIDELPKLTANERLAVQKKLEEISATQKSSLELHDRGVDEIQAADLRARLKTFTEDWERPENSVYDEIPAR